jgi:hypothetical protein
MQNAFSAGPLHSSLPTIAAGEPVAGIALGVVVFGDRIQISSGPLAIEAGGIAALIVGVVMVARSSAFGRLRKFTEVILPIPGTGQADQEQAPAHTTPTGDPGDSAAPHVIPSARPDLRQSPATSSPDGQTPAVQPDLRESPAVRPAPRAPRGSRGPAPGTQGP